MSSHGMIRRLSQGVHLARGEKRKAQSLLTAIKINALEKVKSLVEDGAPMDGCDEFGTPLHYACRNGNVDIVTYLLDHGAPLNALAGTNMAPTHFAAQGGHVHTVFVLCQRGAQVDITSKFEKRSPLHMAALGGHAEVSAVLIGYHAAVDHKDIYGTTPLHLAVRKGNLSTVEVLLEHKANPNTKDNEGWTALHLAAEAGHEEVVSKLIEKRAEINAQNKYGRTPLHWACARDHVHTARLLLQNSADPFLADRSGKCPLDVTKDANIRQMLKYYAKPKTEDDPNVLHFRNVQFNLRAPAINSRNSGYNRMSLYPGSAAHLQLEMYADSDSGVDGDEVGQLTVEEIQEMEPKLRKVLRTTSSLTDNLDEDVQVMALELARALRSEHLSTTNEIVKDVFRKLQAMEQKLSDYRADAVPDSKFLRQRMAALVELGVQGQNHFDDVTPERTITEREAKMLHFVSTNLAETEGRWRDILIHMRGSLPEDDIQAEIKDIEDKHPREADRAFEALWLSMKTRKNSRDVPEDDTLDGFKDVLRQKFDLTTGVSDDSSCDSKSDCSSNILVGTEVRFHLPPPSESSNA